MRAYARAEIFGFGRYFYDAGNSVSQPNYQIADFRVGLGGVFDVSKTRSADWRVEGWIKNAFDPALLSSCIPIHVGAGRGRLRR